MLDGPQLFAQLVAAIPGVSRRMLAERLRDLESAGVVERDVSDDRTNALVYRLTAESGDLLDALKALRSWASTKAS